MTDSVRQELTVKEATVGKNIVLFWPCNFPHDSDARLIGEPIELVKRMQSEGKLIRFVCNRDGEFRMFVFVERPIPVDLEALCMEEERYELAVDGIGYLGGIEYMMNHTANGLDKSFETSESILIPAGCYEASVLRCDHKGDAWKSWLEEHAAKRSRNKVRLNKFVTSAGALGIIAVPVTIFFLPWLPWACIVGATAGFFLLGLALRLAFYANVVAAMDEFHRTYPDFVVHLEARNR